MTVGKGSLVPSPPPCTAIVACSTNSVLFILQATIAVEWGLGTRLGSVWCFPAENPKSSLVSRCSWNDKPALNVYKCYCVESGQLPELKLGCISRFMCFKTLNLGGYIHPTVTDFGCFGLSLPAGDDPQWGGGWASVMPSLWLSYGDTDW